MSSKLKKKALQLEGLRIGFLFRMYYRLRKLPIYLAYSHLFRVFRTLVETRKVGKWEHKCYKHLRDVPIYCFGKNTAK
jgi:hypothetical protein